MNIFRLIAFGVAAVSAAAMIYVGLYQSRLVGRLLCPIFGDGCEGVADAPFARPARWVWIALLVLSAAATLANILGVRDMMNFGQYCFYCLATTVLSPVLLWAVWEIG